MRSRTRVDNLLFDPEIERTARRKNNRRRRRRQIQKVKEEKEAIPTSEQAIFFSTDQEEKEMAGEGHGERQVRRTLEDYASFFAPLNFSNIARLVVNAANMEMKPTLIHLVQSNKFHGLSHENLYTHLATFLEICNIVKIHQVLDEAIRLSLFPFSLAGNAKVWLKSILESSLTD